MTKRMTAMARIERVVNNESWQESYGISVISAEKIVEMILEERARLKRKLKRKVRKAGKWMTDEEITQWQIGYIRACQDILALWEQ